MTLLSKERIEEFHEHFSNYGSGDMDAAPLVESARIAHDLLGALKEVLPFISWMRDSTHPNFEPHPMEIRIRALVAKAEGKSL